MRQASSFEAGRIDAWAGLVEGRTRTSRRPGSSRRLEGRTNGAKLWMGSIDGSAPWPARTSRDTGV